MPDAELLERVVIALCSSGGLNSTADHIVKTAMAIVEKTRRAQFQMAGMDFVNPNRHQEI